MPPDTFPSKEHQETREGLQSHRLGVFISAEKDRLDVLQKITDDKVLINHLVQQKIKLGEFQINVQSLSPTERDDIAELWKIFNNATKNFDEMLRLFKDVQIIMETFPNANFENLRMLKVPPSPDKPLDDEAIKQNEMIERIATIIDGVNIKASTSTHRGRSVTEKFPMIRVMSRVKYFFILL